MTVYEKALKKLVSAVFEEQKQVDLAIERLLERGVPEDNISVIGNNFPSEAYLTEFAIKRAILRGLKQGAMYGSLFGCFLSSFLSFLVGMGVIFVPFIRVVVAAVPLGTALLGAGGGVLAASVGAKPGSASMTLEMPKDKATIYQARMEAEKFSIVVKVPEARLREIFLFLQSAGGEEVATSEPKR